MNDVYRATLLGFQDVLVLLMFDHVNQLMYGHTEKEITNTCEAGAQVNLAGWASNSSVNLLVAQS